MTSKTPPSRASLAQCDCCDYFSVSGEEHEICPICFWQRDITGIAEPLATSNANHGLTLLQGRRNFAQLGACADRFLSKVVPASERQRFTQSTRDLGRLASCLFSIGPTEFFVDLEKSQFSLTRQSDGSSKLGIDIFGSRDVFGALSSQDDSDWSWALYPPEFYIHDFPLTPDAFAADGSLFIAAREDHEIGLYMMEHCEVMNLHIKMESATKISIDGQVELWGKAMPFAIVFTQPAQAATGAN
jgi:hypothetical protein